jgi:hypothetical protein
VLKAAWAVAMQVHQHHRLRCNWINIRMLLNEFIYFNSSNDSLQQDDRYNPLEDNISIIKSKDLRKTRLTLGMINDLRKAGDSREKEQKEHLEFVKVMYATPVEQAAV